MTERRRITIAILALGGQGGGVLADWILSLGRRSNYWAQGTSVPGVAQRTGTTVYYIEMFPKGAGTEVPVLALTPVPGDVDIVISSELMEGGRAILRGFVTDQTTLISSTHRIYAISEKSAMGDGRGKADRIIEAAASRAGRFIGFDMDAAAQDAGSVISSVMFGALAGSRALPFEPDEFEAAIRAGGKAVEANLRGFAAGLAAAGQPLALPQEARPAPTQPTSAQGLALASRISASLPVAAQGLATEGVRRLMDYQDADYAALYLDRLDRIAALDDGAEDYRLTRETARYLALWMSYEDMVRVADLKTRGSRMVRIRSELNTKPGQTVSVTEYMHPRLEEICDALPVKIGRTVRESQWVSRMLQPMFRTGRHVKTTSLSWFLILYMLAGARRFRRGSLRFAEEQARISHWLDLVAAAARRDLPAAREIAECPRLLKGYSDTFVRGLSNYQCIVTWFETSGDRPGAAQTIARLREAALADDKGDALRTALAMT